MHPALTIGAHWGILASPPGIHVREVHIDAFTAHEMCKEAERTIETWRNPVDKFARVVCFPFEKLPVQRVVAAQQVEELGQVFGRCKPIDVKK